MNSEVKLICFISHPRSGSTSLLKTIEAVTKSSSVLEIFHTSEDVIKQHVDEGLGAGSAESILKKSNYNSLSEFSKQDPLKYLNDLKEFALNNGSESLIFKIFPGHIKTDENLNLVLDECEHIFFLRRNTLHSYISNQKAISVGTYANVDTSGISIEFNAEQYNEWKKNIYRFFSTVKSLLEARNKDFSILDYEKVYQNKKDSLGKIINQVNLLPTSELEISSKLNKQDSKELATDKVANANQLQEYLKVNDVEFINNCWQVEYENN
mgnify:CR=1 FL=1